ncbi:MAG: InlB B-repeat-containing protein [Candidatus Methanomethylophilaceae archaeon]
MKTNTIMTVLVAVLAVSVSATLLIPESDAESAATQYYTYSPTFVSTAQDAQYVAWDFGDGTVLDSRYTELESVWTANGWTGYTSANATGYSALLAEHGGNVWMPKHTYDAKGTYTTSQTVYNDYDGGSTDTITKIIEIMGHPVVTFVTNGGNSIEEIEVPKDANYNAQTAAKPTDPVRDGYTFDGWYTDSDLTTAFDWTSAVAGNISLYAKWTAVGGGEGSGDGDDNGSEGNIDWLAIILIVAGVIICLFCLAGVFNPWIILLGLASLTVGILMFIGVI